MTESDVSRQAAEWLIAMQSPDGNQQQWMAFEAWLGEHPSHRQEYLKMEEAWHTSVRLKEFVFANGACDAEEILQRARAQSQSRPRRFNLKVYASATALTLLIALAMPSIVQYLSWARFATTYGEMLPITLADGSKVQLNTKSKMRVHITKSVRDVALDEGEAFFTVEKDAARPFTVHVNDTFVQATGTEFSVRRVDRGDAYTFVAKGSVRVPRQGPAGSADALALEIVNWKR